MTAFSHPNCYAGQLGDCSPQISKEHYVSDGVLRAVAQGNSEVLVRNLAFQRGGTLEAKEINSLVAKVLCEKHNSELSSFDVAGLSLFSAMDQIDSAAGKPDANCEVVCVNGDHFERWMLKTLCGGLFSGTFPLPSGSLKGFRPPERWLRVLFRGDQLPDGQGLYLKAGTPGEAFTTEPSVLQMNVEFQENAVIGFTVRVFKFEYTLVLVPLPAFMPPSLEHASHRPSGLIVHGSNKSIHFEWNHGSNGESVIVQWLG
jgi:hypothetical protein